MELESLPSPKTKEKKKESKSKTGVRNIKLTPKTLGERKIKVPPTTLRRKGAILPNRSEKCKFSCYETRLGLVCAHTAITYKDFAELSRMIIPGQLSKPDFAKLQQADPKFAPVYKDPGKFRGYQLFDNILFKETRKKIRPVLPSCLIEALIIGKHFSILGLHLSKTKIRRDISNKYHLDLPTLNRELIRICDSCVQCQFNSTRQDPHSFRKTNFVVAPRASWAVDIIPSMSVTKNGFNAIFLAVDMFTGYVQLKPLKSRKAEELIQAVKDTIIIPFGIPKFIRSDNETGMQNSVEFKQFLDLLSITLFPCSTASPWSNGAAERAVQTIKKGIRTFAQMENVIDTWDEYIHFFTQSHNKSTNNHGYTPEELHFGFTNPDNADFIEIWPKVEDQHTYVEAIVEQAERKREAARSKARANLDNVITYRNKTRRQKKFEVGQIVIHRQLQVSTGTGGALKTTFTGPYVIEQLDSDGCSATLQHMHTGRLMQAHFTNIQRFEFNPSTARLPSNFDEPLAALIPEKYSQEKYSPKAIEKRKLLNQQNKRKLEKINREYSTPTDTQTETNREGTEAETPKKDEYHVTTRSKSRLQANAHLTSLKASIIQPADDVHIIDDPILIVTGSLVHPSTSVT